jgi:NitT/TauT family transport system permease protein
MMEKPRRKEETESSSQLSSKSSSSGLINARNYTTYLDLAIAAAIFLAAWQAVFELKIYPSFLFPSPAQVLSRLAALIENGDLEVALGVTLERLVAGFGISLALGITAGLLMANFKRFGKTMSSLSLGLQSFPSIAWVPFAILIVGLNDFGILFVIIISSVFSMMISTYNGVRNIPPIYLKAAKNMGVRRLSLLRSVMLPASMPSMVTAVRQTWSFAWHALIGAEMLFGLTYGLGELLYYGSEFSEMNQVIATMIVIFLIGLVADRVVFQRLEDRVRTSRGLVNQFTN